LNVARRCPRLQRLRHVAGKGPGLLPCLPPVCRQPGEGNGAGRSGLVVVPNRGACRGRGAKAPVGVLGFSLGSPVFPEKNEATPFSPWMGPRHGSAFSR